MVGRPSGARAGGSSVTGSIRAAASCTRPALRSASERLPRTDRDGEVVNPPRRSDLEYGPATAATSSASRQEVSEEVAVGARDRQVPPRVGRLESDIGRFADGVECLLQSSGVPLRRAPWRPGRGGTPSDPPYAR